MDDDLRLVVERERAPRRPEVRRDPDRVCAYLRPDFVEFSASGRARLSRRVSARVGT